MSAGKDPRSNGGRPLHLPRVTRRVPYWARLIPPGELPPRAVILRLILALALAGALWVRVSADEDPALQKVYNNVQPIVKNPAGYYPVQQPPRVTITVDGLRSDLQGAGVPSAYVDLRNVPPTSTGPFPIHVTGLPSGAELRSVTPSSVSLQLVKVGSKMVKVTVNPVGAPLGYVVSPPTVSPQYVKITGPSNIVDTITGVQATVLEAGFTSSRVLHVEPTAIDRNGQAVSRNVVLIQPGSVTVRIAVRPQPVVQSLSVSPMITGTVATGYRIAGVSVFPPAVAVVSAAPLPITTTLQTAPIDVTGFYTTTLVVRPLEVPSSLVLQHPTQVDVVIQVVPAPGSATTSAQVVIANKRPGTTVTLATSTVTVVYQGPIPLLSRAGAPVAVLDLRKRQPGVYYLTPSIKLPSGLTVTSITPSRIRVMITAPPAPHAVVASPTTAPLLYATATATARPTVTPRPTATATPRPSPTAQARAARL